MNAGLNKNGSVSRPKLAELEHWRRRKHASFD